VRMEGREAARRAAGGSGADGLEDLFKLDGICFGRGCRSEGGGLLR